MDAIYAQSCVAGDLNDEPSQTVATLRALNLQKHPEGGYFVETDRDPRTVANPFLEDSVSAAATSTASSATRNASTSIFYFISPGSPVGHFHRNKGRTVHTLHRGRGRYILIHADQVQPGSDEKAQIESFVVGHNLAKGEKLQWIVEGGKFKASYLLPDAGCEESDEGLLISETVVPGFDYADHDFMTAKSLQKLVSPGQAIDLVWLLKKEEREKLQNP